MNERKISESFFSEKLQRKKNITVLLPGDYFHNERRYPVLYLLHGYGGNRKTWCTNTALENYLHNFPMIVVLPESGRRWFINDVEGFHYEDYLILELVPYIDKYFRTISNREGRGTGGFSMGGAAAVFHTLRYPSVFSAAFAHSGAFEGPLREHDPYEKFRDDPELLMPTIEMHEKVWGPPGSEIRKKYDPYSIISSWDHRYEITLYLDQGLDDFERMIRMNRNFHHALKEKNIPHVYKERPGKHDWKYINDNLEFALGFIHSHFSQVYA